MNRKLIVIALAGLLTTAGLAFQALADPAGGPAGTATQATETTTTTPNGWTCPGWSAAGAPGTMGPGSWMHRGTMGRMTAAGSYWNPAAGTGYGHMGPRGGMMYGYGGSQ